MKIRWFLPGLMGFLCMASPAMAGELASWRFDSTENSLEFTTDEGVQPRAQLVPDPTRLVIDLPGTLMGAVQRSQFLSGAFRQIRIGQWDANTTRIVVELAPGYMLDPQQVSFRGISPTQWTVQLPSPEYAGAVANTQTANPQSAVNPSGSSSSMTQAPIVASPSGLSSSSANSPGALTRPSNTSASNTPASNTSASNPSPIAPAPPASPAPPSPDASLNSLTSASATVDDSVTQIELMQVTDDGLFLRTAGATPEIDRVNRSRDRRSITITLENAVLSPQLTQETAIEQFGVERLQFKQVEQDDDEPPTVEITLEVDRDSPNWNATVSGLGGIVLLPRERVAQRSRDRSSESENVAANSISEEEPSTTSQTVSALPVATIEGIDLDPSGTQLLIHSDRPVTYTGQWQSGMYQVRLSPAHLAAQVTGPQLDANSPLLRVRLRQEDDDTVVVMIQPASGIRFGALNLVSPQLLSLEMERSRSTPTSTSALPVAATNQTFQQNSFTSSFPTTGATSGAMAGASGSRTPSGQIVIVIDPGHGGADVGAVGVGNIHEADVVLPIAQQVGALLQQQGVQVVMTRNDDREIDLEPRVQMAEQANATLFVSIHANSMGMDRPDVNGTETYYYSNGAGLAQVIQDNIVGALDMNDRGIKQARFYVLRRTTMPAVLVEIGYVTGSEDGRRLGDSTFQSQMARAIAQGILQYIQSMASQ